MLSRYSIRGSHRKSAVTQLLTGQILRDHLQLTRVEQVILTRRERFYTNLVCNVLNLQYQATIRISKLRFEAVVHNLSVENPRLPGKSINHLEVFSH